MAKEAYYFSHDSNARNDEKILALLIKHKWEGYGLYWAIIEKLRESTCYKLSIDYNLLAYDLRTSNEIIKSIVTGFGLFTIDENEGKFWSNRLLRSMEQKSEKAKKAAEKRWNNADAMQVHSKRNASGMQNDAIKVKESKVKKNSIRDGKKLPSSPKPDLDNRQKEFYKELIPFVGIYGKDMIREFYDYWREPNKSKTLMRCEQQKTWDLKLRLDRWNRQPFNSNQTPDTSGKKEMVI